MRERERERERERNRQTERQAGRQTRRQTDGDIMWKRKNQEDKKEISTHRYER